MSLNISEPLSQIYQNWLSEDRAMEATLRQIRVWMKEVEQLGTPHFGETAARLQPLHDRLVRHFEREDEMIAELASSLVEPSAEFDHLRFESTNEHGLMLAHLEDLLERLGETDPPFRSWQAAMQEVEKFVHRLEQHESTETRSIAILLKETS